MGVNIENEQTEASKLPLTFDALRYANVKRCEQVYHLVEAWNTLEWGSAVTGCLGSLLKLIKRKRGGAKVFDYEIRHELADVQIYLDLLAAELGIDLGEAVREKFNVTSNDVGSEVIL